MNHLKLVFIVLLSISIVTSCSSERSDNNELEPLSTTESYEELNISYGNNDAQVFDLYLPANRTTDTKTIILIHGGGWTTGDKTEMNYFNNFIKNQMPSYAVVNINYRLADESNSPYPMQVNDITSVVNYLKNNETHYTISNNLGFVGVSAGAHLSLL